MTEVLQWSAGILALIGAGLWWWSASTQMPSDPEQLMKVLRRQRRISKVAAMAAVFSALLQAQVVLTPDPSTAATATDIVRMA